MSHSKLPWTWINANHSKQRLGHLFGEDLVLDTPDFIYGKPEDAAFIVKAVNERESILRDFHGLLYELITYSTSNDLPDSLLGAVSQAQETLKQAEAE